MYQIPVNPTHPPALQALQRLMEQAIAIDTQMRQRTDWIKRTLEHTRPSAWTTRIEGALDKPEQLEILRRQRREALIEGEMLVYGFYALGDGFNNVKRELFAAIQAVVSMANDMPRHSEDEWLKPILVNAALQAEEIRRNHPSWSDDAIPNQHDSSRDTVALAALKSAFADVAAFVKGLRVYGGNNNNLQSSLQHLYPLTGAVTPESLGYENSRRDEMRTCNAQPFVDTVNTEHPALRKLAELLPALDEAVRRARNAAGEMRKGEKGKVNERQYAARLVTILDGQPNSCGTLTPAAAKDEQKRQKTARLTYQSQRVLVYSELVAAEDLRRQVVATLREAIVECETLEAEIEGDSRATVDKLFSRRLALINCIAADVQLRRAGRDLTEAHAEYANDITEGKGATATANEYAELTRYYDSFKPRPAAPGASAEIHGSGNGDD